MADNVSTFYKNWAARIASAKQIGLPPSSYVELMRRDYTSVQQGNTPLPNAEVRDALLSQLAGGNSIVGDPTRNPTTNVPVTSEPSNFLRDVGSLIWHLPGGIAHLLAHAPSEITDSIKAATGNKAAQKKLGMEPLKGGTLSQIAEAIRNIGHAPVGALIPGVTDLAALTTSTGRKGLEKHPAGALADVLPLVGKAAELGLLGEAGAEGSVTEALQAGRPLKAAYRALPEAARAHISTTTLNLGLNPKIVELISRPRAVIQRTGQSELNTIFERDIRPLADLPPAERARLQSVAAHFDPATATPEDAAVMSKVASLNELHRQMTGEDRLPHIQLPSGHEATYAADSPVVVRYQRAMSKAEYAQRTLDALNESKAKVEQLAAELQSKGKTVRGFRESDSSYQQRLARPALLDQPSQFTPHALRNAARDLIQPFRDRNLTHRTAFPEFVQAVRDGKITTTTYRAFAADLKTLSGEKGLFAQLDDALAKTDVKAASRTLSQIRRLMRHGAWSNFPDITQYIDSMRESLIGMRSTSRAEGYAARKLATAQRDLEETQSKYTLASKRAGMAAYAYMRELQRSPAANFQPMIEEQLRAGAVEEASRMYHGDELKAIIRDLQESPYFSTFAAALGPAKWKTMYTDIVGSWLDLVQQGFQPVWMSKVNPAEYEQLGRVRVLSDHLFRDPATRAKVMNFAPGVSDIAAGITQAMTDVISEKATAQYITDFIAPHAKLAGELEPTYRDAVRASSKSLSSVDSITARAQRLLSEEWVKFDPTKYGLSHRPASTAEDTLIPRWVDNALSQLTRENRIRPHGLYSRIMKVYKFSVLTTPRHLAHVAFGGMAMLLGDEPAALAHLKPAIDMLHDGHLPPELGGEMTQWTTDNVFHFKAGQTLARNMAEAAGGKLEALRKFEDNITNMYKAATMLTKEARGIERDAAISATLKVFVDRDALLPIERTIISQVFPFWAFTRHILQYVFTYPVDHPLRAAILTHLAEQHQQDWKSGIPEKYAETLFLGKPDAKGNVASIDLKTLNPFRSLQNIGTMAGFFSMLNPTISAPFEAAGFNTLTGSGDLFPQLTYDPQSGTLVAKHSSAIPSILKTFIPESTLYDMFVARTADMKRLKASNPTGYRQLLFSSIGIPFVPETQNPAYLAEHAEIARYRAASAAISADTKSGDFTDSEKFRLVPYRGQYLPPAAIANFFAQLQAQLSAANSPLTPKAVISNKKIK